MRSSPAPASRRQDHRYNSPVMLVFCEVLTERLFQYRRYVARRKIVRNIRASSRDSRGE